MNVCIVPLPQGVYHAWLQCSHISESLSRVGHLASEGHSARDEFPSLASLHLHVGWGFLETVYLDAVLDTVVIRRILSAVGSGPSQSSPLPFSLHTFATSLGTSGLMRMPRTLSLSLFRLGSICLIMDSFST